jgi:hypothetical protein
MLMTESDTFDRRLEELLAHRSVESIDSDRCFESIVRRAHHRIARRRLITAAVVSAFFAAAALVATTADAGRSTPAPVQAPTTTPALRRHDSTPITSAPSSTPRACSAGDLDLTMDPAGVSEASGQNTIVFRLTNRASSPCRLYGYPVVRLLAANGQAFPFKFGTRGDMMLTTAKPAPIELAPGATAFGAVDKYRCDLGDKGRVTRIEVVPPGQTRALVTGLGDWATVGDFGYCGPGDPGSSVDIAPLVATPDKLLRSVAG